MKILIKLILSFLTASVLPLIIMGCLGLNAINKISSLAVNESTESLKYLGEESVRQRALDVAKQIEIYIRAHPGITMKELQSDKHFIDIALQKVGKTGYTFLHESTGTIRIHPNEDLIDRKGSSLAKKLPAYWNTFQKSLSEKKASGYYDWIEPDNSVRQKYMAIVPVQEPIHRVKLMVAATTYTDEFYQPIVKTQTGIFNVAQKMRRHLIIALILLGLLAIGLLLWVTRGIKNFLKRLMSVTSVVKQEDLESAVRQLSPDIGRKDELGRLAESLSQLALKLQETSADLKREQSERYRTEEELRKYREDFEVRVRERTSKLARMTEEAREACKAAEIAGLNKSRFLAGMSNELRTSLNVIIGYSEMFIKEPKDRESEDFVPDLKRIHAAGKHLLRLLSDVLDLSKIEAGKMELYPESFDVSRLITEVTAAILPLAEKNSSALQVHCVEDIGFMYADRSRVRQGLFNILNNACKFTEQGTITLDVNRETSDGVDRFIFTVNDTGIGMTPEQMKKLFQPFVQTDILTTRKYGVTRLGLVLTKHFCQMMGGDIHVRSEYGVGTTVTIRLPARMSDSEAEHLSVMGTLPKTMEQETDVTVLVIESDPDVRNLIKRFLNEEGFKVRTVFRRDEGLRLTGKLRPHAVIVGVMTSDTEGWTLVRDLKTDPELADIEVIAVALIKNENTELVSQTPNDVSELDDGTPALPEPEHLDDPHSLRAIVVEENVTTREMLRRMLEKQKWKVDEAENGSTALERILKNGRDLILLDMMMPQIDVLRLVGELRRQKTWISTSIVAVTAGDLMVQDMLQLNDESEKKISPREVLNCEVSLTKVATWRGLVFIRKTE